MAAVSNSLAIAGHSPTKLSFGAYIPVDQYLGSFGSAKLSLPSLRHVKSRSQPLVVQATYSDGDRPNSAGIFIGGFVLGGLVTGTLGFIHAPQCRLLSYGRQLELISNFRTNRSQRSQRCLVLTACAPNDAISTKQEESSASPKKTIASSSKVSLNLSRLPTISKLREIVSGAPSFVLAVRKQPGADFLLGFLVATTCVIVVARMYVSNRLRNYDRLGTVDDLVRRGQLRSDRRGISSQPLQYDDPFNNPLVKAGQGNSVEMCGKVYKLAPVTLTEEQRTIHKKRRSRAYEWKRPKVFLKEGDDIPPDVDPDTVRWIPANHPFATTSSDIDEDLAQNNVYQKHGVPFRIRAEHEAMQKKLEALQSEQKPDKVYIDPRHAKDFERALKAQARSREQPPGQVPPQTDGKPAEDEATN